MEITKLTQDLVGKEISCIIDGTAVSSAKIYFYDDEYFIIQDYRDGGWPDAVKKSGFGYKYGWNVSTGSKHDLRVTSIKNIQLTDGIISNYEIY